jgi:hypothetical protein
MMPVPSKPQKTDGFHVRTDKDPEVTGFSHIFRAVVMKPKIRVITSGSVLPLPSVWKMRVMCHAALMHSATLQANGNLISCVDAEKRNYPGGSESNLVVAAILSLAKVFSKKRKLKLKI